MMFEIVTRKVRVRRLRYEIVLTNGSLFVSATETVDVADRVCWGVRNNPIGEIKMSKGFESDQIGSITMFL